jgi:myo-inositol-1(or 4)-monophosphatase
MTTDRKNDLARIDAALDAAAEALSPFTPGAIAVQRKAGGDPVTQADHAVDRVLRDLLPRDGEGWLSEETVDDRLRLERERAWIVDPLDGTREFVEGLPEWCVSVALVEAGEPVAGGILNPATDQRILGAAGHGVTLNGEPARVSSRSALQGAVVLASRTEVRRGEWERFDGRGFEVRPCGSVAYKLSMVAAGQVDATWSLVPKNEWDVAAGVALIRAAGGQVEVLNEPRRPFNRESPWMAGLVAYPPTLAGEIRSLLELNGAAEGPTQNLTKRD